MQASIHIWPRVFVYMKLSWLVGHQVSHQLETVDSDTTSNNPSSQFYSLHQNTFTKAAGKNLQDLI